MTTATSTRGKTEFLVSQHTSSKELFDQLNVLKADKGVDADLPIRAYDEGRKGTTLKIYKKETSGAGLFKAAAYPQRVSARVLVIKTIEKILKFESEKSSSLEEKETINQVLGDIKAKKSYCINHDIKIPDLIADLSKLKPIWDKTNANSKTADTISSTAAPSPQKTEPPKETNKGKSKPTKTTVKNFQTNADINPTHAHTKLSTPRSQKPNLNIKQADFDLSKAINLLSKIQKYGEKYDVEFNSKARIRVGEIKDTDELSFYVSIKDNRKIKKSERLEEGRKDENKTTTTKRAITVLRSIADSLAGQNRISTEEVNKVFSAIEKQGYISVNDASSLLDLLETGRRAVYVLPIVVQVDSNGAPDTPPIPNINTNPLDETPIQGNRPKSTPPQSKDATITTVPIKTVSTTSIQSTPGSRITNRLDDTPTKEPQTPTSAPPSFFQRVVDFFKPVTNFFASIRRFFGFN